MLKDDNIHRQLDIALAQPSDDPRKHVRRKGRTLYPTTTTGEYQFAMNLTRRCDVRANSHQCGENIANHGDQKYLFAAILVR